MTAPPIPSRVVLMRLSWLFPVCGSGFDFTHFVGAREKNLENQYVTIRLELANKFDPFDLMTGYMSMP